MNTSLSERSRIVAANAVYFALSACKQPCEAVCGGTFSLCYYDSRVQTWDGREFLVGEAVGQN